jgi:hypothetical protein
MVNNENIQIKVSLNELIEYCCKKYKAHFESISSSISVLDYYFSQYTKYGHFWLGGEKKLYPDDKITEKLLIHIKNVKTQRMIDSPPCNSAEYASVQNSFNKFEKFLDVFVKYEEVFVHEMYRPPDENNHLDKGGILYQKILNETLVGKHINKDN